MWDLGPLGITRAPSVASKKVSTWLQKQTPGVVSVEDRAWLGNMIGTYYDQEWIEGWSGLRIVRDKFTGYNRFILVFPDDTRDGTFSYKKCFSMPSRATDVKKAMRTAVDDQALEWKTMNAETVCGLCRADLNLTLNQLDATAAHADHFPVQFDQLVYEFLEKNNITMNDIQICDFDPKASAPMRSKLMRDGKHKQAWEQYHREHAGFRILCAPCNTRREKWAPGLKKRPRELNNDK